MPNVSILHVDMFIVTHHTHMIMKRWSYTWNKKITIKFHVTLMLLCNTNHNANMSAILAKQSLYYHLKVASSSDQRLSCLHML